MPKVAFIGAGSTMFTKSFVNDVLCLPELAGSAFALMDIDPERLLTSEIVTRRLVAAHAADATVEATLDRHGDWIPPLQV
jgi:alpha-galactosidase